MIMDFIALFDEFKESAISGRYITNTHIEPLIEDCRNFFKVDVVGKSVLDKDIYAVTIGTGKIKILMWSQMHGNESTTTKALFDLFNFLKSNTLEANLIKERFTLLCIPILNPDGSHLYTRENANGIDLNRDAVDLSQPESIVLQNVFHSFHPDYCYNLHDQRSIYAVGDSNLPATVSFLAPAYNKDCDYNPSRLEAVKVIAAMNKELQKYIPNQIGRFDDSFNLNCVGDMFQTKGVPTILFEAGHFQEDYEREKTRQFIFIAYLSSLQSINENDFVNDFLKVYLDIPQNKPIFYDFIYKKVSVFSNSLNIITNFAAHYEEILVGNSIEFKARIIEIGNAIQKIGHQEYDLAEGRYSDALNGVPEINNSADFVIDNSISFVNGQKITN
jgi:Zinc carboxypeptidase